MSELYKWQMIALFCCLCCAYVYAVRYITTHFASLTFTENEEKREKSQPNRYEALTLFRNSHFVKNVDDCDFVKREKFSLLFLAHAVHPAAAAAAAWAGVVAAATAICIVKPMKIESSLGQTWWKNVCRLQVERLKCLYMASLIKKTKIKKIKKNIKKRRI